MHRNEARRLDVSWFADDEWALRRNDQVEQNPFQPTSPGSADKVQFMGKFVFSNQGLGVGVVDLKAKVRSGSGGTHVLLFDDTKWPQLWARRATLGCSEVRHGQRDRRRQEHSREFCCPGMRAYFPAEAPSRERCLPLARSSPRPTASRTSTPSPACESGPHTRRRRYATCASHSPAPASRAPAGARPASLPRAPTRGRGR